MQPLYCFRLNEETGEITKHKITEYETCKRGYREVYFYRLDSKQKYEVYKSNLDKLIHGKYHTFDGNDEKAIKRILDILEAKRDKANDEYNRWYRTIKRIHIHTLKTMEYAV